VATTLEAMRGSKPSAGAAPDRRGTSDPYLEVRDLAVQFTGHAALRGVSFDLGRGERLCLLGPSGCGKTTSLHVVAGFTVPDGGTVRIAGRDMAGVPPERRNIGVLFQSYALFPHLTVYDNIAFGLRMRGLAEREIRRRVGEALELVRLPRAAGKRPATLSGGEQQRIAFARAVVIQPSLLLLDEPFSNLDARLRQEMRSELLDLLQQLSIATVMVTHDQEEAMAIADRIVVMHAGRVEQIGGPTEIYERPRSLFVARFVGESNCFAGRAAVTAAGPQVEVAGLGRLDAVGEAGAGGPVQVVVRPEKIRVLPRQAGGPPGDRHRFEGVLERAQYLGHRTDYRLRIGPHVILAWRLNESAAGFAPGDAVTIEWLKSDTLVFPEGADA
jgi:ABC-type Fe3+/spermidine/putrescine transport system ATPase subunit